MEVGSYPRPAANQRLSGLDGAMDELEDVVFSTHAKEDGQQPATEVAATDASCFGSSSSSKGKQKGSCSPSKMGPGKGREPTVSSPVNSADSPKKNGEHSPVKAKLEQVTSKLKRIKKDDPRSMSPDEKTKHKQLWRDRFQKLKVQEMREIHDYIRDNTRKSNHGPASRRK